MALQQHRIVRFLMILTAVLLTIFIYASYYSNLTMTIPSARIHQQQAALMSLTNNNNNDDISSGIIKNNPNSIFVVADKQNIEKIQLNSGNEKYNQTFNRHHQDMMDDSNVKLFEKNLSTIVSSNRKDSSTTDLLKKTVISTTTSQQNCSTCPTLQNATNSTVAAAIAAAVAVGGGDAVVPLVAITGSSTPSLSSSIQHISPKLLAGNILLPQQQQQSRSPIGGNGAVIPAASSPSSSSSSSLSLSSASSLQPPISSQSQQQQGGAIDTSKGISTANIYEGGHLDVNPQLCRDEGESLRLFIAITSAPTHREARLAIRQTWGHYGVRRDVSIAFILGRTMNQAIEDTLSAENYMYGDLIRGRFIDSYNNLTLKTISALEWVDKNCPQAAYVLKTDDDMFINVPKLLSFIDRHHNDKRTIFGRLAKKWKPIRNKKSKYYVSPGQFALTVFPQFTTGPAYLLSSDIIHDLYVKSLEQTYLKLEDVYTTGIVAQILNIKRVHVNEFLNRRIAFNPCNIRKAISVHMIKSNEQFDLWKKLLDTTTKCK